MEEIQQFFTRHKAEIAKDTADVDVALKEALIEMKNSTAANVNELNRQFISQSEEFKTLLKDEKESFEKLNEEIKLQFKEKIEEMPVLVDNIKAISQIPERLDSLVIKIEQSNMTLADKVSTTLNQVVQSLTKTMNRNTLKSDRENIEYISENPKTIFTTWMNWCIITILLIIAVSCTLNLVCNMMDNNMWPFKSTNEELVIENQEYDISIDSTRLNQ